MTDEEKQRKLLELREMIKGKHLYVKFRNGDLNTDEYERFGKFSQSEMRKTIKNLSDDLSSLYYYDIEMHVKQIRNGVIRVRLSLIFITEALLEDFIIIIYDRKKRGGMSKR